MRAHDVFVAVLVEIDLLQRMGFGPRDDQGGSSAHQSCAKTGGGSLAEVFKGHPARAAQGRALDARSDIFSLGMVLWELLLGRLLFARFSDVAVLEHRHSARRPGFPSKLNAAAPVVPKELDEVVLGVSRSVPSGA